MWWGWWKIGVCSIDTYADIRQKLCILFKNVTQSCIHTQLYTYVTDLSANWNSKLSTHIQIIIFPLLKGLIGIRKWLYFLCSGILCLKFMQQTCAMRMIEVCLLTFLAKDSATAENTHTHNTRYLHHCYSMFNFPCFVQNHTNNQVSYDVIVLLTFTKNL